MLLAYIDEIGETGAFVSKDHDRFKTSPAFGYAGFVIPAENARRFGERFTHEKRTVFKTEIAKAADPGKWERKGATIFRPDTYKHYPQQIRVFNALCRDLVKTWGGALFYYADEKPLGTPAQTKLDTAARETAAMRETLNRLCTFAEHKHTSILVMIDQITEKTRAERLPNMYGHILSRATERQEMKRIIEPPMHVDSVLSSNIQFADWIAAAVTRAIEYQTIRDSPYSWIPDLVGPAVHGGFTFESKLHLWSRSVDDLNHIEVFHRERRLHPTVSGHQVSEHVDPAVLRRIHAAAERATKAKH